jgi:predicted DCC family thiol-disulfide oxidoreductase YuxK
MAMPAVPYSYRGDLAVGSFPDDRPLVIFDGYCGLCSRSVQFILRHDKVATFRFMQAQSALGAAIYRHYGLATDDYETVILLVDGRLYTASDAALGVLMRLPAPWPAVGITKAVPLAIRDWVYGFVAKHRMRFFGRSETCCVPTPEQRERFLDGDAPALTRADASP